MLLSEEDLLARKDAVLQAIYDKFDLHRSPPSGEEVKLYVYKFNDGDLGFEVRGFALPSSVAYSAEFEMDGVRVLVGTRPRKLHEADYFTGAVLNPPGTPSM